jgi:Ferredoxin-like domain in Api92-like protein
MANDVTNYLSFEGKKDQILELLKKAAIEKNGHISFDFEQFFPMPKSVFRGDLNSVDEWKYPDGKNWYGWSIANWGTKWNAYSSSFDFENLTCKFDTALSVPTKFLLELSRQYPELTIVDEWIEEVLESAGRTILKGGKIVSHDEGGQFVEELNLKHNREYYLQYLEELKEDS